MISSLAREIAYCIDANAGKCPTSIRVPQYVVDECVAEAKHLGLMTDKQYAGEGIKILGIPVFADPILTIGKIDT